MLRILWFLVLVFAIGLGFAWLADRPGNLVVTFSGYQYQVTLMTAAVIITAIVAAVMLSWWLVKSIWSSPFTISRYFRVRRRDRGYQALSTGLIAAGAGDAGLARKKKREAMKLISADQEPLIHLLDAQASLLEGDHEAARRKFEAMAADPETRLLGLRGLYLEAERLGDRVAAQHYAARASEQAPQLGWAADVTLGEKTEAGAWDEALRLVDAQKSTQQIDRAAAERRKAVLLTAKAIAVLDADPAAAKTAALEAHRLAPGFVPASVTAARALFRLQDTRKGAKILEAAWKVEPHPEIAEVYVSARSGDSTHDRLDRAKRLQSLKLNNVDSALAVARAALDAGEFVMARSECEAAIRIAPRESAYLLLADIEEAQTGDQGKVRQWLGKALRAPRDPAWVADGYSSERWAPVSPVTGRLDAFEWRVPAERLGALMEPDDAPEARAAEAIKIAPPPVAPAPIVVEQMQDVVDIVPNAAVAEQPSPVAEVERTSEQPVDSQPAAAMPSDPVAPQPAEPVAALMSSAGMAAEAVEKPVTETPEDPEAPMPPRLPDDPGVDPEEERDEPRRFRLF